MKRLLALLSIVLLSTLVVALAAKPAAAPPVPNVRFYTTSEVTHNVVDQTSHVMTVGCSEPARPIGGGAMSTNPAFVLVGSDPDFTLNGGWRAEWRTIDGNPHSGLLIISVMCALVT
jgi:hypothetical protein